MRSRGILLGFGAICLFASVVCAYLSIEVHRESLVATPSNIDFGTLEQSQTVSGEFVLVNHFRQPIEIAHVFEACSCSTTGLETRRIEPGKQSKLAVAWKTGAARGATKVDLHVQYTLDDQRQGILRLSLNADVLPDIRYEPREVTFKQGAASEQVVQLAPGRMSEFLIEKAYVSHRAFKATVSAGNRVVVGFDPSKWRKGDDVVPQLTIATNSERVPRLIVDLRVSD